jgi:hypothetical protein
MEGIMRAAVCIIVVIGLLAHAAIAQAEPRDAAFWKAVQTACDATAARPANDLGKRIAQIAIEEFNRFGGHRIDANGWLFRFGLTEAEHQEEEDDGGKRPARLDHLGWWQVIKYWRALFGDEFADKLEVRGYRDASTATQNAQEAALLRTSAGQLLRAVEGVSDPEAREILREAAERTAVIDTPWSAVFVSFVVKEAGVEPKAFHFANAHRVYIYEAFATSAAEVSNTGSDSIYRACPLTTRPRTGDLICQHREAALANASDGAVRERIRSELNEGGSARSVRRTHCEAVVHVDVAARKVYTVGGNVNQAVSARKLNLRRDLRISTVQKGKCSAGDWTLPRPAATAAAAGGSEKCSLNDKKWFVLLQLR